MRALGEPIPPPRANTSPHMAHECNDKKSFTKFLDPDGDLDHHQNFFQVPLSTYPENVIKSRP